jgi:transcriptional regulator with XRE-family HTH domain
MTIEEHAATRVHQLWIAKRFTQAALARKLNISKACAHAIVQKRQRTTLAVIEAVSALTGIPLLELLAQHDTVRALSVPELKLIEHFRVLSRHSQRCWIGLIETYAMLAPETQQEQQALGELRHLPFVAQRHAYAYLLQLAETHWTGDLLAGLSETPRLSTIDAAAQPVEHWTTIKRKVWGSR